MITIASFIITHFPIIFGRSSEMSNFYDYPKFYQRLVMRQVEKEAGEKQRSTVAECSAE